MQYRAQPKVVRKRKKRSCLRACLSLIGRVVQAFGKHFDTGGKKMKRKKKKRQNKEERRRSR